MAFANKIGNLLKQSISSNPSLYQAIRCMSSSKLFVGGISYGTDDQSLREAFTSYGEVVEARVIMDRETGRSRGFGFITFTCSEEASAAMNAMDGKDLHGRIIRVNYATDRSGGFRSGGYGGSGYGGGDYSGGGNYASNNYNSSSGYSGGTGGGGYRGGSAGGYAGSSSGANYGLAGGGGGRDGYINNASSASGTTGFGDGGFNFNANPSSTDGSYDNSNQDDLLKDDYKDDDEHNDYANKRG